MIRRGPASDGVIVVLITALAWYVRWPGMEAPALSFADSWVALIAHLDNPVDVARVGLTAPGFALLAKMWFLAVGFSTTAAQTPAFVVGVATPGLTYLVARRIGAGRPAAAMAGLLIAVSPIHAEHSVMLKQYTLDALMSVGLVWLTWPMIDDRGSDTVRRLGAVVIAAVAATLMSASVAPVAVSSVAAAALVTWRSGSRDIALTAFLSYAAIAGSWALVLMRTLPNELGEYWIGHRLSTWDDVPRVVRELASGLGL